MSEFLGQLADRIIEILPTSALIGVIFFLGVIRYGASFADRLINIGQEYRQKSDVIKEEYIALLESERDRLKKRVEKLESKIKDDEDK